MRSRFFVKIQVKFNKKLSDF